METLEIPSGLTIGYEEVGVGPVLVQVHGLATGERPGEGVWNFKYVTPLLAKSFTVVNVVLPGYHGPSNSKPTSSDIYALGDYVAEFIRAYRDGQPRLVHGTSFGGCIGIAMAGRHPDVVQKLVASVCSIRDDKAASARRKLTLELMELNRPDLHVQFMGQIGFAREFYDREDAAEIFAEYLETTKRDYPKKEGVKSLLSMDLMQFADSITVPLLGIGGSEDRMTPSVTSSSGIGLKAFCERVRLGEYAEITGCGHFLTFEKPEETVRLMTEFLLRN